MDDGTFTFKEGGASEEKTDGAPSPNGSDKDYEQYKEATKGKNPKVENYIIGLSNFLKGKGKDEFVEMYNLNIFKDMFEGPVFKSNWNEWEVKLFLDEMAEKGMLFNEKGEEVNSDGSPKEDEFPEDDDLEEFFEDDDLDQYFDDYVSDKTQKSIDDLKEKSENGVYPIYFSSVLTSFEENGLSKEEAQKAVESLVEANILVDDHGNKYSTLEKGKAIEDMMSYAAIAGMYQEEEEKVPSLAKDGINAFMEFAKQKAEKQGGLTVSEITQLVKAAGGDLEDSLEVTSTMKLAGLWKPDDATKQEENKVEDDDQEQQSKMSAYVSDYMQKAKEHEAEIKEAEKNLGGEKKILYNSFRDQYSLDATLLDKATPEQMSELDKAISVINGNAYQKDNNLAIDVFEAEQSLMTTFNEFKYNFTLDKVPLIEDKIQSKIDFFEQKAKEAEENGNQTSANIYKNRVNILKSLPELYKKYSEEQKAQESYAKQLEDARKVLEKYQNPYDTYSVVRHNNARKFDSIEEAKYMEPLAKNQRANFTADELHAIKTYTGNGYSTMNKPLHGKMHSSGWGTHSVAVGKAMSMIKNITNALDKCQSQEDFNLIRRVGPSMNFGSFNGSELIKKIKNKEFCKSVIGQEFVDNSIMSCSTTKSVMKEWGPIDVELYCPKGIKMHYCTDISTSGQGEAEVILGRGYHMVIREAYWDEKEKKPTIKADVILGSDSDRLSDSQLKQLYDKYLK